MRGLLIAVAASACSVLWPGNPASALVIVRVEPPNDTVSVGEDFVVTLVADVSDPIVGFGLDVAFDGSVVSFALPPLIGSLWIPVFTPDGDGLAGAAFPTGISGTDILLATLFLSASTPGETEFTLGITPGDLTEGFALEEIGMFDSVTFVSGHVTVPEPSIVTLLGVGFILAASRAGRRSLIGLRWGPLSDTRGSPGALPPGLP